LQKKIQPFQSFLSSLPGVEGAPFSPVRNTARGAPIEVSNKAKCNCSEWQFYEEIRIETVMPV
jgi:hypothetical protein